MAVSGVCCAAGHNNPVGQKFCGQCGASIQGMCPNGHSNPPDQKFCGECGTPLSVGVTQDRESPIPLQSDQTATSNEVGQQPRTPAHLSDEQASDETADTKAEPPLHGNSDQESVARVGASFNTSDGDVVDESGRLDVSRHSAAAFETASTGTDVERGSSLVHVGQTFMTGTGELATVRGITGNDVWVDVEANGRHVGTFRFPLTAVETALSRQSPTQKNPLDSAWKAAMDERAQAPSSPIALPAAQPTNFDSPLANGPTPRLNSAKAAIAEGRTGVSAWWGGLSSGLKLAVVGGSAILLLLFAVLMGGGGGGGKTGGGGSGNSGGSSSGGSGSRSSGSLDDWVAAVCRPGTYSNHGGDLQNADASGFCMSRTNMPIMIGQYSSSFSAKSDAAMIPGSSFAMLPQDDGRICLFLAVSARSGTVLQPLAQFGAKFGSP